MITASGDGTATLTYMLPDGHGGGTLDRDAGGGQPADLRGALDG